MEENPETLDFPWSRVDGEPELWYGRFSKYFLPLGPSRTLLKAYTSWMTEEKPEALQKYLLKPRNSASTNWSDAAFRWQWRDRARQYDNSIDQELPRIVEGAKQRLLGGAEAAAQALINSLNNPRLAVAAAKEILDRAGLPANSVITTKNVPYTADDLAAARKELEEWEHTLRQTNASDQSG